MITELRRSHFISINTLFIILAIFVVLFVVFTKIYILLADYTYIGYGFDTSRILVEIGSVLQNSVNVNFAPRVSLVYLSSALKTITNIPQADILALPLIISSVAVLVFIYLITKLVTKNFFTALFAPIFFGMAVSAHLPHPVILYSFVFQPLLFYALYKYLNNKISYSALFLIAIGAFITYPPILFTTLSILSIYAFYELVLYIVQNDIFMIKKYSNFFLLLPCIFLITYFPYNELSSASLQGLYQYLKNSMGLWLWSGAEFYLYILVLLYFSISLFLFSLRYWFQTKIVICLANKIIFYINHVKIFMVRSFGFLERYCKLILYFFIILLMIDLLLSFFLNSYSMLLTYILFSWVLHSELWRDLFSMIIPLLILSIFGIFIFYPTITDKKIRQIVIILSFPVFFLFTAVFPSSFEIFQTYASSRGIEASYVLILPLFSFFIFDYIYRYLTNRKFQLLFISILLLVSINISLASSKTNFSIEKPNVDFITGMKWLENNKISSRIFYVNPDILPSPPPHITFYGYSFIYSEVSISDMTLNNTQQYDKTDFSKFIQLLEKTDTDYIVLDADYPDDGIEKMKKIGKLIFENNGIHIFKYMSPF